MTRSIYIIVEGQTEEQFVNELIQPYFYNKHDFPSVIPRLLGVSGHKGGAVNFGRYRLDVELLLKQEKSTIVTSLIDFYKLGTDFPKYKEAKKHNQVESQVALLENACTEAICNNRFVPYIQLHEFEALLFSAKRGFEWFGSLSAKQLAAIEKIITQFPNPELINDSYQTAPAKRLEKIMPSYDKVLQGNIIALENGFQVILNQCPRFSAWIAKLEERLNRDE